VGRAGAAELGGQLLRGVMGLLQSGPSAKIQPMLAVINDDV